MRSESLLQESLTNYELNCVPVIVNGIKGRGTGKQTAITNTQIQKAMKKRDFHNLTGSRIRKIISHIRNNNLLPLLCANSNGYYIAGSLDEFNDFINTFEKRVNTQLKTLDELKSQRQHFIQTKMSL